jgi:hypothetical protein
MNELARYLADRAYIDFQRGITTEEVRKFLRDDDSRDARALLSKPIEDAGVEDLMVTVADCLKEHIRSGINEGVVRTQLITYSDSRDPKPSAPRALALQRPFVHSAPELRRTPYLSTFGFRKEGVCSRYQLIRSR